MAVSNSKKTIQLDQFHYDFFKTLDDFRKKNMFCDVTLLVDGKSYPCHRLVLTASSSYFQTMFNGNFKESSSNSILIEQINAEVMDQILNAIYTAQIQFTPETAYFILKGSHFLQLNGIVDSCVSYIAETRYIHYLLDTCLFANIVGMEYLFETCVTVIADHLMSLAKCSSFEKIPFKVLNRILSAGNFVKKEDELLLLIMKWAKSNPCTSTEIRKLLGSSKFSRPAVLAELVLKSSTTFLCDDNDQLSNQNLEDEIQPESDLSFNLYLNTIDRTTGAIGWSSLNLNTSFKFEKHTVLFNFHPLLDFFSPEFCRVGAKIYCFEFNVLTEKYEFSYYENNEKTIKNIPHDLPEICNSKSMYGMVAMDSKILLFNKYPHSPIWVYDCETETTDTEPKWNKMFEQTAQHSPFKKNALHEVSGWLTAICLNGILYIIGAKSSLYNTKKIIAFDKQSPTSRKVIDFPYLFELIVNCEYASACTFDGKIAISASNYDGDGYNEFDIYDVNADKWLTDITPMNNRQSRYKLIYGDGFIYAVGNSPFMMNEKYDIKSNTWTDLPPLPKELPVKDYDNREVSINYVHFAEVRF